MTFFAIFKLWDLIHDGPIQHVCCVVNMWVVVSVLYYFSYNKYNRLDYYKDSMLWKVRLCLRLYSHSAFYNI